MTRQMKTSGVEWIGDIPEKWDVCKVINCLLNIGSGTTPQGLEYYENECIPWLNTGDLNDAYIERTEKSVSEKALSDYSVLKRFDKGSVVVAMYGATVGKLGIVSFPLVTNQACCVMTPNEKLYNMFLFYLFMAGKTHLISLSLGSGQPNINQNTVKTFDIPFPSFSEQKEIADYLDAKCAKIDVFIAKQKTVVEKLKEYKQSVITEAVTKGLNPAVPMKSSGVEWIGDIPEKWQILRLKNTVEHINEKTESIAQNYIGLENIESWTGHYINQSSGIPEGVSNIFRKNDILFSKLRPYLAKCLMADFSGICSSELLVLRNFKGYSRFLFHLLLSHGFINIVDSSTYGSKMPRANYSFIGNVEIPYPPLSEQKAIADYLDAKCAKIDAFIAKKQVVIEKLTEYKKSLIYECVTGKREIV